MRRSTYLFILPILFLVLFSHAEAGRLYARRAGTEAPLYNLKITAIRTSIQIWNQLAVTHVDEEFHNDNNLVLEGFYAFQLPEGAKVDGLWLWVDGKRLKFIVKRKEEAQRLYDSVVIGTRRDPAILESLGSNRFQLKVCPINPRSSRRIEIRYLTTLPLGDDGRIHYTYPLNNLNYQTEPVDRTEMVIDVHGEQNIPELTTSFDNRPLMNRVTRIDDRHWQISFGMENQNYVEDYHLAFLLEGMGDLFPVLTWKDPAKSTDDLYFMLWYPLPKNISYSKPRDYVFVLDASGSMAGRIDEVKAAFTQILRSLDEGDRFRLVLFASNAMSSPADTSLWFATKKNVADAIHYIDYNYAANGGTNYQEAFRVGLSANFRPEAEKRMIFLTDGEPTVGAMDYQSILATIRANDPGSVRIFPVLIYPTRIQLLYDIAAERWGQATNLEPGDDLGTVIGRFIFDLAQGGYRDFGVTFQTQLVYDVYPRSFKAIMSADRLISAGQFKEDGDELVTIRYLDGDSSSNILTRSVHLAASRSSVVQVSRYWASKKIDALLDDIRQYGETKELKENIIALSCEYMILTPYTAFLVLETNPIDPTDVAAEGTVANDFMLHQNYPNPFNPSTTIRFDIPERSDVRIVIHDILGRVVRTLVQGALNPGRHSVVWDGRDDAGMTLQSGTYFCTMRAGAYQRTLRMVLLK